MFLWDLSQNKKVSRKSALDQIIGKSEDVLAYNAVFLLLLFSATFMVPIQEMNICCYLQQC